MGSPSATGWINDRPGLRIWSRTCDSMAFVVSAPMRDTIEANRRLREPLWMGALRRRCTVRHKPPSPGIAAAATSGKVAAAVVKPSGWFGRNRRRGTAYSPKSWGRSANGGRESTIK